MARFALEMLPSSSDRSSITMNAKVVINIGCHGSRILMFVSWHGLVEMASFNMNLMVELVRRAITSVQSSELGARDISSLDGLSPKVFLYTVAWLGKMV